MLLYSSSCATNKTMACSQRRLLPPNAKLMTLPALSTPKRALIPKPDRLVFYCQDSPGPGSYDSPSLKKPQHHLAREENWTVPRQHQWIVSKGRQPFEIKQPCEPQLYAEQGEEESSQQRRSDWAKNQRFNYDRLERKDNVGPGKYSPPLLSPKQRSHTLPARQRASPAHYLKQLIQHTHRHRQLSDLEEELLKIKMEAIQAAKQPVRTRAGKTIANAAFKSNSKRLNSERELTGVGPGSYELSATPARVEKPALRKNQVNSHERTKSSSLLTEQAERERRPPPGPGAYELQTDSHRRAALGLILREERFSSKGMQAGPGPGEYMRKRFVHLAPSDLQQLTIHNPFARPPEAHPSFGTTERFESRQAFELPFGQYNLGYYDISQKLMRQREQHCKLRPCNKGDPALH